MLTTAIVWASTSLCRWVGSCSSRIAGSSGKNSPIKPVSTRYRAAAGPFTALPVIIYNWAGEAKAEFKAALALAAIIVLVAITSLCNGVAVFLRNRYDKRW